MANNNHWRNRMPANNEPKVESPATIKKAEAETRNKITGKAEYELRGLKLLKKVRKLSGVRRFHIKTFKKQADAEKELAKLNK